MKEWVHPDEIGQFIEGTNRQVIHREPFPLHPNNSYPFMLYDRIVSISNRQPMATTDSKGRKVTVAVPTMSHLPWVLEQEYGEQSLTYDKYELLMRKLRIIHDVMVNKHLAKAVK